MDPIRYARNFEQTGYKIYMDNLHISNINCTFWKELKYWDFFILFRSWVINKNVKNECVETRSFFIFANKI